MPAIWTTPRSWPSGELITSTIGNSAWRDNFMYLKDSPTFDGTPTVTGNLTLTAALISNSATDATSALTGAIQTDGGLGVVKALWVGGLANIAGAVTMQSTVNVGSTLGVGGASTFTGAIAANGGVVGNLTGNVTGNVTGNITGTAPAGTLTGTTLAANVVTSSLTTVGTLGSLTVTGALTVDTTTLVVDATNNRVGVGIAAPLFQFQVESAGGTQSYITSSDSSSSAVLGISVGSGGGGRTAQFRQNGSGAGSTLDISSSGNITLAPSVSVSVTGTLAVSSTVTGGTYNGQTISSSASLTGTLAVASTINSQTISSAASFTGTLATAGSVGFGQAISGNYRIEAGFNGSTTNGSIFNDTASATGATYAVFAIGGSVIGSIARVAATSAVVYNTTSDKRLKTDLGKAVDVSGLLALDVRDYTWNGDETGTLDRGVFAQDAYAVMRRGVTPGSDDLSRPWAVEKAAYVPDLIVLAQQHEARLRVIEERLGLA